MLGDFRKCEFTFSQASRAGFFDHHGITASDRIRRIATTDQPDDLAQLTSQEQKILLLVAEGKTNKEIAADVFLSDKTVKNYVSSILAKLNLEMRAQAAAYMAHLRDPGRDTDRGS